MLIWLNGSAHETGAATLAALVEELGLGGARVATALNGAFAPAAARPDTPLAEGDRVEVVTPMAGG